MPNGRVTIESTPSRGEKAAFSTFARELAAGTVYLLGSGPTSSDAAVECITIGDFGKPAGLSRNHLELRVAGGTVEAHDHSRFGTFWKHARIDERVVLKRPEILSLAGVVRLRIEPPVSDGHPVDLTELPHSLVITGPVRRHMVAALAADHIVAPESRGAYLLTDDELAVLFQLSPDTAKEHLARARAQIKEAVGDSGDDPRTREELIDWVKAWGEISEVDVAAMDAYLQQETGRGYEDAIRAVALRRRSKSHPPS